MKTVGIVRNVDFAGRIVLPIEIRKELSNEELGKVNGGDNFNVTDWNGYSSQS